MITKGYGITIDYIDDACPKDLEPYEKAYNQRIKTIDSLVHTWFGEYGISAFGVAIDHNLNGRKAKSEYVDTPLMSRKLDKYELRRERERFANKIARIGANFRLRHGKGKSNEQKSD